MTSTPKRPFLGPKRNPDCACCSKGYTYTVPTQDNTPITPARKTVEVTPPVFDPSMVDELPRDEDDEESTENSLGTA